MNDDMGSGPVLVTGGAGFIGSHIAEALHAEGREVHILDSLATGRRANVPTAVRLHIVDIRSAADVGSTLRQVRFEAIVHCAAQTSVERSMLEPEVDREVNVVGTHVLLDAARQAGVRRFVFMSSGGAIYGETSSPATEDSVPAPRSFYGIHKYVAEEFVRASGLPFAILRPSNVYGPRQRSDAEGGVLAIFSERLAADLPIVIHGDGSQVRDFVYVSDLVAAVLLALESSGDHIWNVCSGRGTSVLQAARLMARQMGFDLRPKFAPRRAGDIDKSLLSPARLLATGAWGPPRDLRSGLRQLAPGIPAAAGRG